MVDVIPDGNPLTAADLAPPPVIAGVDVGGTRTKLALLRLDGRVIYTEVLPPRPRTADEVVGGLTERLAGVPLVALGVALPGFVDRAFGSRDLPGKLPGMSGRNVASELGEHLGVAVVCLNDGQAAAVGEWRAGVGHGFDDLLVVTLGTGVGSGVILNGQPLAGGQLGVGNGVGHWTFDLDGDRCLCGNLGCPETRVSATAVVMAARTHLARGVVSTLANNADLTFEAIGAADVAGDRLAGDLVERFTHELGVMLASGVQAYGSSGVVIAGGMARVVSAYVPRLQAFVESHVWRYPRQRRIPVLTAALGDFSGAVGAALAALDDLPGGREQP